MLDRLTTPSVFALRRGCGALSVLLALAAGCSSTDDQPSSLVVTVTTGGQSGASGASGQAGHGAGGGGGSGLSGAAGVSGKGGAAGKGGSGGGGAGKGGSGQGGAHGGASAGGMAAGGVSAGGMGGTATAGSAQSGGEGGIGGEGGAPLAVEDVHISGRTDKVGDAYQFGWSGVSFSAHFSGTGISVVLEDGGSTNDFEVIVDDVDHPERKIQVTAGTNTYTVIDQLPAGEHTATIHRRTEGSYGVTTFHGFTVEGGAIIPTPSPYLHRIEVIGDSITCGYGTECTSANEAFSSKTENHWLTYGAIASRNLAADAHTISWSGKGLIENYGTDTSATMPELYPQTFASTATPPWDFGSFTAEVVVIDLGTNDWNHSPSVDPATFEAAYDMFAASIEARYPNVIVFGVGNTLVGKSHTQAVASAMSGKPNRHYIEFSIQGGEGVCCQHPCAATHARWGMELTQAIQSATGWLRDHPSVRSLGVCHHTGAKRMRPSGTKR